MSESKPPKNIYRFEKKTSSNNGALNGWWVRVQRNGKRFSQLFSDSKHGGKEKALEAAIQFRDIFFNQFGEDPNLATTRTGSRKLSNRNKTGIEGVHRANHFYTKRGKRYFHDAFVANWPTGTGKQATKSFSVKKYGEAEAFLKAVKARQDGLKKLTPPKHEAFLPPENKGIKIWRYMDFTKFIWVIR